MKCESCEENISSKMRGALANNLCPFCSKEIMPALKAEQYLNLLEVLEQTTFTNRMDVDSQIRDKVANLLMGNFVFKKLAVPESKLDIIVLDDENEEEEQEIPFEEVKIPKVRAQKKTAVQKVSSTGKALNAVTSEQINSSTPRSVPSGSQKSQSPQAPGGFSAKDYINAQNDPYSDPISRESNALSDFDGLTPEEILKAFPDLTIQDIEAMKQGALGQLQQSSTSSGRGIKRLT